MVRKPTTRANSVASIDNVWGRRSSILPSLSWKKASEVQIVLDGEQHFVPTFSTFDQITGHVNLRFEKDVQIDDIAICLQGQTNTWIEKVATTSPVMGKTTGKHTFLRVQQPIDESCLPENHRALAGVTYTIPFQFVVPERILDFICGHKVAQSVVKDAHLQLPPSIGDPMLAGVGNTLMDDLAPKMAKISYCIRVGILRAPTGSHRPDPISEELGIRIVPAREESPPLTVDHITKGYEKYCLRKEKNVRKGILKLGKKQGRLTAEATQPSSLKLRHPLSDCDDPITTMATINFRYDPASADEQPPSLNHITNKLKVHTFFGAAPWHYFPTPGGVDIYSTLHSHYPESIELSSRNVSNVEWTRHEPGVASEPTSNLVPVSSTSEKRSSRALSTSVPSTYSAGTHGSRSTTGGDLLRRQSTFSVMSAASDSTTSTSEGDSSSSSSSPSSSSPSQASSSLNLHADPLIASPSTAYDASLPYYTTTVLVPITLPTTSTQSNSPTTATNRQAKPKRTSKPITFLPTFHSCLVSRIYSLDLSVDVHSAPTINLRVPIQVSLPYDPASTRHSTSVSTSSPHLVSEPSEQPPAIFNPEFTFSSEQGQDQNPDHNGMDVNDEAIAQLLESQHHRHRQHPDDAPEYEDTYQVIGREGGGSGTVNTTAPPPLSTRATTRHLSLLLPPHLNLREAPPDYEHAVRRTSAMQRNSRARANPASASVSTSTPVPRVAPRPAVVRYIV